MAGSRRGVAKAPKENKEGGTRGMCAPEVTRLHSVPSAFQLATVAVVFRNILKPTCAAAKAQPPDMCCAPPCIIGGGSRERAAVTLATRSTVSRKSPHLPVFDFARNSSMSLIPML